MRFRVLGPVEVQVDGSWSSISATKWRTMLAVLLLRAGEVVPTEQLIGEVWPQDTPATAVNLISVYVLRLRRLIGDAEGQLLVTRSRGYQLLAGPGDVDAQRFARLAAEGRASLSAGDSPRAADLLGEALGLWHGSRALADVPDSPMISAAASGLDEARVEALELRINADLGCGRQSQLVAELRGLLSQHRLREGLWALLMRALYSSGRQAEALEAYAQAREVIAGELGVDPGAELRQLHEQMLRADAGPGSQSSATKTAAADSPFTTQRPVAPTGAVAPPGAVAQTGSGGAAGAAAQAELTAQAELAAQDGAAMLAGAAAQAGAVPDAGPAAQPGPPSAPRSPVTGFVPSIAASQVAQLPADIPDFTGRTEHVQKLHDLLAGPGRPDSPGAVVVAAVIGAGGLGKTTLAVHAAHQLRGQFPDGQLYANLHGAGAQPVAAGDVLARFLRDLGMDPERIPVGEEERAAQFRSRVTDRRVLIVLDDAKDAAHVRPLLPGSASCAVLVTTRNRMPDLAGSRFVDLDVLDAAEAWDMFAGIIGPGRAEAEPEATRDVLTACAGLPLAIRIAGARLAARGGWTVRTIAARLADERRRLDWLRTGDLAVRACFEVSFTSLPRNGTGVDPTHAFRVLGLWPGPTIGLPAAAALLGQPEEDVADALEVLVDAQLLQAPAPDRYRFHDLLRTYAAERALAEEPAAVREDAIRRLLTWYLYTVEAVAQMIAPHRYRIPLPAADPDEKPLAFGSVPDALKWCEAERPNLVAGTRQAAASEFHQLAWRLAVACLSFFHKRAYWADWVETHQIALASARAIGDRRAEALVMNNLGTAFTRQGMDEAAECFEQALAIRREIGDLLGEAQSATNMADNYVQLKRFDEALELLNRVLEIRRQAATPYGEGVTLNNLGETFLALGRFDEAVDRLTQARQIFHDIEEIRGEGYALANLGGAYLALGHTADAIGVLERALELRQASGERYDEAHTLRDLGRAYQLAGQDDRAAECLRQAATTFTDLGNLVQAAAIHAQLGEAGV
jgi:DNA-binding SARP family transcriptional activator/tetratricopeptide (TPR) repeat protein